MPNTAKRLTFLSIFNVTAVTSVESYYWKHQGREPYGYVEDQGRRNILVKRWKWQGLTLWKRTLDTE